MNVDGTFQLWNIDAKIFVAVGVSGNAMQRRLYVRRWKRIGYVVKQYNAYTRTVTIK